MDIEQAQARIADLERQLADSRMVAESRREAMEAAQRRSAQDVERRIVEARIDEVGSLVEGGFYLAPANDYERGWNASKVDSRRYADKRISELRASLATDRAGDGEG